MLYSDHGKLWNSCVHTWHTHTEEVFMTSAIIYVCSEMFEYVI
jgi:hypothetical protein